jgi:hypothetical protein
MTRAYFSAAPLACGAAVLLLSVADATAADKRLNAGGDFEAAVESLAPGDTLTIGAGDYVTTGRVSITVRGTAAAPVVIQGAPGEARPHIRRAASAAAQNTINVEGATHLTIRGLEISSNDGDGINLNSNPSFITLENLEIHDVDVGVNFRSNMNNITVRNNHIFRTGAGGGGTGEGMYVGCNDAACVVRDSLIERNWVHDTRSSTQGDGIEVKLGSYNVIVRDNVIHDTGYPCVLVYGTNGNPVNIVEGNAMWNCGDSGIQAAADAIIRNNLILESPGATSFNSQPHQAAVPQNLQFVHNTVLGGSPCVRLSSWNSRPGLVFANNAIYCESNNFVIGGLAGVTVAGNVITPQTSAFPAGSYRLGQARNLDLLDASGRNVYPTAGSRLLDAGAAAHAATTDFNGRGRGATPEAGAYEWSSAQNPGWSVAPGFKGVTNNVPAAPDVTLSANPASVASGGSTTLAWTSANANGCTGTGGVGAWAGNKTASGSTSIGPLSATTTFGLSCTGSGGTTDKSVVVTVTPTPTPPPTPAPPELTLSASTASVTVGGTVTLTWSSVGAASCAASGAWSGAKALSGTETVGPINANSTYFLACTNSGGTMTRSATVSTTPAPAPAPTNTPPPAPAPTADDSSSGSGSLDLAILAVLLATLAIGKHRPASTRHRSRLAFGTACLALVGLANAADVVNVDVVNTSGSALTDAPVTFGQVFAAGDVPQSASLQARFDDGTVVPVQVDRKATHANGSLRHAVVTLRLPSIAASATRRVVLATGTSTAGAAPTTAELLATDFDARTTITIGGVSYAASARELLAAGTGIVTWLQGALGSEWVVRGPLRRSDGTAHPHLAAQFEVRAYSGVQRARVGVGIENVFTRVANPQRYAYDLTVTIPGRGTVLSRTAVTHYRQSRWRRTFWWGNDSPLEVRHDSRYLIASGAVPSYDMALRVPNAALDDMFSDFNGASGLMDVGNLNPDMPAGGGRPEIAPLPGFAARYIISQDLRAKRVMVGHGEQAGTWPMHYRDEATGLPVSIDTYPNMEILGNGIYGNFPACGGNCSVPFTPETAHHPSLAYLPYLVTGDYYHLEELHFWANWVMVFAPASRRNGSEGLVVWDQVRGQAWGLRTLGQAVYATPDNHPLKSYFSGKLQNNLRYYNANWLNSNPLGYVTLTGPTEWLGLRRWIATWMDDFLTWSFGHLVELGFEDARQMRDWKSQFPTGRMTHPDMCWIMASTYWPTIMDNHYLGGSGNPVRTWADYKRTIVLSWSNDSFPADARSNMAGREQALLAAACDSADMQQILGLPRGWMMGYGGQPDGYPANLQPALAIAVDAGIANASAGWTKFRGAASYPDYNTDPQWAVVPRNGQTTPPPNPLPTVNLAASPTSVASGQNTTLTWTSQNATSCTASGGWSGAKAVNGSQSVGPLTANSSYTLACTGAGGTTNATVNVTVQAPPPAPSLTFTANPTSVTAGGRTKLTWSATNATACTASGAWSGAKATSGTEQSGALAADSTFALNCTGAGGTVSRSVTVTVGSSPPPPAPAPNVSLSASPASVASGARSRLTWSADNSTACTASGAWSGSKAVTGSEQTAVLTTDATFALSCAGPGGATARSITVTVTAPAPSPAPAPTPAPTPAPAPSPAPPVDEQGGGGAMGALPLAMLGLILAAGLLPGGRATRAARRASSRSLEGTTSASIG